MKIFLEPVEWAGGEAYRVRFDAEGEGPVPGGLGYVWREGDAWRISAMEPMNTTDPHAGRVEADTPEALRTLLEERFRAVEIPSDRLSNMRMHEITAQVLIVLSMLAKRTGARPGFVAALAGAVARAAVTDIKPEGEASFLAAFDSELKSNIATLRTLGQFHKAFAHTFAELFKDDEPDDEDAPSGPRH